jgi:hypothetical protein
VQPTRAWAALAFQPAQKQAHPARAYVKRRSLNPTLDRHPLLSRHQPHAPSDAFSPHISLSRARPSTYQAPWLLATTTPKQRHALRTRLGRRRQWIWLPWPPMATAVTDQPSLAHDDNGGGGSVFLVR